MGFFSPDRRHGPRLARPRLAGLGKVRATPLIVRIHLDVEGRPTTGESIHLITAGYADVGRDTQCRCSARSPSPPSRRWRDLGRRASLASRPASRTSTSPTTWLCATGASSGPRVGAPERLTQSFDRDPVFLTTVKILKTVRAAAYPRLSPVVVPQLTPSQGVTPTLQPPLVDRHAP